jgi:hypothetical protein
MKLSIATATAVAAAAACLVVAGCSGGGSGTLSAAGARSSIIAAATGAAVSTPAGDGSCKQLTFAEVQPLITDTVISVATTAITVDGHGQQCVFSAKGTDSTGAVTVQVLGGSQGTAAYVQEVGGESKPVAMSGVGDKASRDTEDGEINALKGNVYCSVSYSSSDLVPGAGPLEEAHGATNNIGENFYDTIAQAMGTLCNRIYGSGNTTPNLSSLLQADATATPSDDGGLPSAVLPTDGLPTDGLPTDASS